MKTASMFSAIQKSKTVSSLAFERVHDYMDLLRVELKIREQNIAMKLAGYAVAGLFALLATIFLGLAIIVSFWDSSYRTLAAWFVVVLYAAIAGAAVWICTTHFRSPPLGTTLRSELRRDMDIIKESI